MGPGATAFTRMPARASSSAATPGEADDGVLGRRVGGHPGRPSNPGRGGDVDDRPVARPSAHGPDLRPHRDRDTPERHRHHRVELGEVRVRQRPGRVTASHVVDGDDELEGGGDVLDSGCEPEVVRHIEREDERAVDPLRHKLAPKRIQRGGVARGQENGEPLPTELAADRPTDATIGAEHEGHAAHDASPAVIASATRAPLTVFSGCWSAWV